MVDEKVIQADGPTFEDLRESTLHEMQHAVDHAAGRPSGASFTNIRQSLSELPPEEFLGLADKASAKELTPNKYYENPDAYLDSLATYLYKRDSGEARARAVERRKDLTDEQRLNRHPRKDMDVPVEQQTINKYKARGGKVVPFPGLSEKTNTLLRNLKHR